MTNRRINLGALIAVMLVLLLVALVRIINIDGPALWTDEGFTYYTFKIDLFDALLGDRHPPFYFYTLHAWEALTGDSILALRWWSFLPSIMSVAVSYQIGRELLRYRPGIKGGVGWLGLPVLAALVIALADAENYMAQELRMYTWHVFFSALSTLLYLRLLLRRNRQSTVFYILAVTLSLYTHYFGAFVPIVHLLHVLIFGDKSARNRLILSLGVSALLFAPWFFGVTLRQFADDAVCFNCATSQNWDILLDFREKWLGGMWPLTLGLILLGLVIVAYNGDQWRVKLRPFSPAALLIGLIVVPVAGTFALGHDEAVLLARRMVQITLPLSLLIALGLANLRLTSRVLVVAALIAYGVSTVDWYRIKVPWHTITELSAEYAQPGELALMDVGYEESALLYYYDHLLPDGMQISSYPVWSDMPRIDYTSGALPALIAEQPNVQSGIITAWVTFFSPDPSVTNRLEEVGYVRTMTRVYDHLNAQIDVYRYDLLPEDALTTLDTGMILRAAEIVPDVGAAGRIDLWWGTDESLSRDFVVSALLLDENGTVVAQYDSQPVNDSRPTTSWQVGDVIYDPRVLQLADGIESLPPGTYQAAVRVYGFTPSGEIENFTTQAGDDLLMIGSLIYATDGDSDD